MYTYNALQNPEEKNIRSACEYIYLLFKQHKPSKQVFAYYDALAFVVKHLQHWLSVLSSRSGSLVLLFGYWTLGNVIARHYKQTHLSIFSRQQGALVLWTSDTFVIEY